MDLFSEVVQVFGVPRSVGQIYGLLYASPSPLSFTDIVERLEISKGSASQGLQLLRALGAICEAGDGQDAGERAGGGSEASRRVAYVPELSLRRLIHGVLNERVKPLAAAGSDRLGRLRVLAEQAGSSGNVYLDRVEQLEIWRKRLKTVLPLMDTLLSPKPSR